MSSASSASRLTLVAVPNIPLIKAGDDLAATLVSSLRAAGLTLIDGDVIVVAQKIVSKAEGRQVDLASLTPSGRAQDVAAATGKDPRLVEAILSESQEVLRALPGVLIVVHRLGFIVANAGIDRSNVDGGERDVVLLLPRDPEASAVQLKTSIDTILGVSVGVVVNDSFGRPWRNGVVGVALGSAGVPSVSTMIGEPDLFGRPLEATEIGVADEIAAAASLLMGQGNQGRPVVVLRGLDVAGPPRPVRDLLRPKERDLFR